MTSSSRLTPSPTSLAAQSETHGLGTTSLESILAVSCLALLAFATFGPVLTQSSDYHAFADQRTMLGIPHMMDVLSNLAFAALGMLGLRRIRLTPAGVTGLPQTRLAGLFFCGMVITAMCSAWYHLQPDDTGLAIDRLGMAVAYAGLLGLAAATRVSERAGQSLALAVLVGGAWSIENWSTSGNVLPWAMLQFGGLALLLCLARLRQRTDAMQIAWPAVVLAYALAKVLEQADAQVFHLTHELVSGHTLKHLVASLAGMPVLAALAKLNRTLESPPLTTAASPKG